MTLKAEPTNPDDLAPGAALFLNPALFGWVDEVRVRRLPDEERFRFTLTATVRIDFQTMTE